MHVRSYRRASDSSILPIGRVRFEGDLERHLRLALIGACTHCYYSGWRSPRAGRVAKCFGFD